MKIVSRLLRKNISGAQLAGFVLSNFIGLAIVISGLQFYGDVRSLWESEDSFIKKDYLVVNRKVTASDALGQRSSDITDGEIAELERQPWVRRVGRFSSVDYKVSASMRQGDRGLSTFMFFESIPSGFIDVDSGDWGYKAGSDEVPVIISKDYLTLYNFGFAGSAGMPQLTEQMIGSVPLTLRLTSDDGLRQKEFSGRIVGFSNRLNTILVPQEFMDWSNGMFGSGRKSGGASRLIVDVSSPGDAAIMPWLESHGLEAAGDKSGSQASYLLNVASGVVVAVGLTITVLSFFILMLSVSLLMTKNRRKLHTLIMLGYPLKEVGAPYRRLIIWVSVASYLLGVAAMLLFRQMYAGAIAGIDGAHMAPLWISAGVGAALAAATIAVNIVAVGRKVRSAFYNA